MNSNITVLIAEDEIPTQRMLMGMINQLRPSWQIVTTATSVEQTIEWLQNNPQPDLMFLDIQLSDGISFEIFEQLNINSIVIFTTAFDEYAVKAFKVNSIDYLLKPVKSENLEAAIVKFEKIRAALNQSPEVTNLRELASAIMQKKADYRSRILVPTIDGYIKLNISDVAFINSSQKITTAVTFEGKPHVIDITLERLEEELNQSQFFRANRQFILNIDSINKIENWFNGKLVVKTAPVAPEKVVVSRERARNFKDWINR